MSSILYSRVERLAQVLLGLCKLASWSLRRDKTSVDVATVERKKSVKPPKLEILLIENTLAPTRACDGTCFDWFLRPRSLSLSRDIRP